MVNDADPAVRAAVDGLGIAYTIEALAEPFLRSGRLVRCWKTGRSTLEGIVSYYRAPAGSGPRYAPLIDDPHRPLKPGKSLLKNPLTKL